MGVRNDLKVTVRVYYDMGSQTFSPARIGEVEQMEGLKENCRQKNWMVREVGVNL